MKIQRNDPCPCGSGNKYKKCCLGSGVQPRPLAPPGPPAPTPLARDRGAARAASVPRVPAGPPDPRPTSSGTHRSRVLEDVVCGIDPFDPIVATCDRYRNHGGAHPGPNIARAMRRLATPALRAAWMQRVDADRAMRDAERAQVVTALVANRVDVYGPLVFPAFVAELDRARAARAQILLDERRPLDPTLGPLAVAACQDRDPDAIGELARRLSAGLPPLPWLEDLLLGSSAGDDVVPLLAHLVPTSSPRLARTSLELRDDAATPRAQEVLDRALAAHAEHLAPLLIDRCTAADGSPRRQLRDLARLVEMNHPEALELLVGALFKDRRRPDSSPLDPPYVVEVVRQLHRLGDGRTIGQLLGVEADGLLDRSAWAQFVRFAADGPFGPELAALGRDRHLAVAATSEVPLPATASALLAASHGLPVGAAQLPPAGLAYFGSLDFCRPCEVQCVPIDPAAWPAEGAIVGADQQSFVVALARPNKDGALPFAMLHRWLGCGRRGIGTSRQTRFLDDAFQAARALESRGAIDYGREIRAAILAVAPDHAFARCVPEGMQAPEAVIPTLEPAWHERIRITTAQLAAKLDLVERWAGDVAEVDAARMLLPGLGRYGGLTQVDGVAVGTPEALALPRRNRRLACSACDARLEGVRAGPCRHVISTAIADLWRTPAGSRALERSAWEALLERVGPASDATKPRVSPRYVIDPASPEPITMRLTRSGGRRGASLVEPEDLRWLSERDRRVHGLLRDARRLLGPHSDFAEIGLGLYATALRELVGARDVRLRDRPVTVVADPVQVSLVAVARGGGGVTLRYEPRFREAFDLGAERFALLEDDRLAPVATEAVGWSTVVAPETIVPAAEVPELLAFLTGPLAPAVVVDPTLAQRGAPVGQLVIDVVEGYQGESTIVVSMRCVYRAAGAAEIAATPGVGTPLLRATRLDGTPVLVARDLAAETALLARATAVAGVPPPITLTGEQAFVFLDERLPAARPELEVLADELLLRRLRRAVSPTVTVGGAIDWLDLQVRFHCDGIEVDAALVLEAWHTKRRYLRLADGSIARLPFQWLVKHGSAAEAIAALRGADGRLPAFAAALAASLVDDEPAERPPWVDVGRRLAGFDGVPEREPPAGLNVTLRRYQQRGYEWLAFLRDSGLAGVLADDMGLGKTVQTLALLVDTHRSPGPPSLVVAPTSVVQGWAREAARFAPDLRVTVYHGPRRDAGALDGVDVVVTSYALLRLDPQIASRTWRCAVLDEAQHIKNATSHVACAARALRTHCRFALSGTPLENHVRELWSLFEFLLPGFFGTRAAFERRYTHDVGPGELQALQVRIRPFVLRRLKSEVAPELPALTTVVLHCELGGAQRRVYETLREAYRQSLQQHVADVGVGRSRLLVLEALVRLRQACCDPRLLPEALSGGCRESAKLVLLFEVLERAIEEGHRSLVFSQWPSLLRLVAVELTARGISHLYLDGGTRDRAELVTRWNGGDGPPVFLISLKAGGTGLNLTGADHVIHLDPWWNPAAEQQATDRAHRIGQQRPVVAYKLVARGTVEERVLELQRRKQNLFTAAIDTGRLDLDGLTLDDLEACFGGELPEADPAEPGVAGTASGSPAS